MKRSLKRILARFGVYVISGYKSYFFSNRKIVKANIYGREVLMPKSHSILYNLSHFPHYNTNLQRIARQYQQFRNEQFSIIDVGANIGDTLLMLRQVTDLPVHCFEGDKFFYDLLEKNSAGTGKSYIHQMLLSDKPGTLKIKNELTLGTSVVVTDENEGVSSVFDTIDHFFRERYPNEKIGIIKTDTDGYDLKILRGAAETIRHHHPVVFLEYDRVFFEKNQDNGLDFFSFMKGLDYEGLLVYDNYGKLVCATTLDQRRTIAALHSYIKTPNITFPFYDLAFFSVKDCSFFEAFTQSEIALFEQG
jgi:FkbM family methyltransferase